jgi:hypothetical protein
MQLIFFKFRQNTMLDTAKVMNLSWEDVDLDKQGMLTINESAFGSDRSRPDVSDDESCLTIHDLYVDEHGMIRVEDSACLRVGMPPCRYP